MCANYFPFLQQWGYVCKMKLGLKGLKFKYDFTKYTFQQFEIEIKILIGNLLCVTLGVLIFKIHAQLMVEESKS